MAFPHPFQINESRTDGWLRLSLTGELDRASAQALEERLTPLRVKRARVLLDLSNLDFIDSSGIHLLVQTIGEARLKHWEVEIDPNLSPQVARLFKLVHLDRFVLSQGGPVGAGSKRGPRSAARSRPPAPTP
jgi:anti-anti-sigma factor